MVGNGGGGAVAASSLAELRRDGVEAATAACAAAVATWTLS
eukprot:CAMPEP_0205949516 /NCGR_PEP_ID=MMETSP1459-20131121/1643_1 /ASSEMBLY_ACC=CAM_ASM_001120 /TAXON_ID=41880 /ORGANISM="Pycnococcus provasolii, Strain RCC931" /LENGTH=40 /DNA_ID= /DNA_START= /DNA_END= /DNA_ORIENTATION=